MRKSVLSALVICISAFVMAQSATKSTSHQVVKGETLYSISKQYHVSIEAIEKANKALGENFKLKIGQKLIIPTSSGKAPADAKPEKATASTPKSEKPAVVAKSPAPISESPASGSSDPTVHVVVKGETVYAIARANGLTAKQLKDANHLGDDMKLKLGQKLIIPVKNTEAMYKPQPKEPVTETKAVVRLAPAASTTTEQGKDYLTSQPPVIKKEPVKPQETIEQIKPTEAKPTPAPVKAEKPRETPQDENPFEVPKPTTVSKSAATEIVKNENINPNDYAAVFAKYTDSGKKKVVYRGIGIFMQNDNPGNQFLALYNYADMGSILKVTNLMSKEAIYVKVIGKVPSTDTQKDVILKLSSDAASKLKVTEDKFLVEVTGFNIQ